MMTRLFAGLLFGLLLCMGVMLFAQSALVSGAQPVAVLVAEVTPEATVESAPEIVGDAARGETLFTSGVNGAPPCTSCHTVSAGRSGFQLGPSLRDIGTNAALRAEGMTAEAYLRQSILEPGAFVVPGFRDMMYPHFADHLSEQDLADLIAYLLTL